MRSFYRWSGAGLVALAAMLFSLGANSLLVHAQAGPSTVMTIAAGGSVQIQVRGFCLDFGKPFPTTAVSPQGLAAPGVRAALNYAFDKGYVTTKPDQVTQAMWFLSDNTWHNTDHAVAQEIVDNSKTAATPTDPTGGQTISDAIAKGTLTATVTFAGLGGAQPAYGDGTLTIKNTGSSDVQVFLPLGTLFPPSTTGEQRLVGFSLGNPQAGAGGPAETPAATATTAATATSAATATAAPTETALPTATAAPTEAPAPPAMPTETPTLPGTPQTGNLPTSGNPTDGSAWWLLIAGAVSLLVGLAALRRAAVRA